MLNVPAPTADQNEPHELRSSIVKRDGWTPLLTSSMDTAPDPQRTGRRNAILALEQLREEYRQFVQLPAAYHPDMCKVRA